MVTFFQHRLPKLAQLNRKNFNSKNLFKGYFNRPLFTPSMLGSCLIIVMFAHFDDEQST